ncbi:MAG: cytidine deaminase [Chloroflexi bacterium]|nr:cytidine deaminase [Chloroflexota bacterium]
MPTNVNGEVALPAPAALTSSVDSEDVSLLAEARAVREHAYAPFSQFPVGAALIAGSGKVYHGCNIENTSFGLTICAERVAIFNAVAAGEREIKAIAVMSRGGGTPCGACRQVLAEFTRDPEQVTVLVGDLEGYVQRYTMAQLLPYAFGSFQADQVDGPGITQ